MSWSMLGQDGQRKYLTRSEVNAFLAEAKRNVPTVMAFCWVLAATGCRISEALELKPDNIDYNTGSIVFRSLKKRGKRVYRAVPIPDGLLKILRRQAPKRDQQLLWAWSRMTAYRRVCEIMSEAGIKGAYASPKGLRHAFGVNAVQSGVPLNLVQRWLGHADIKTTAIYTSALGDEERAIASRMWGKQYTDPALIPPSRQAPARRTHL